MHYRIEMPSEEGAAAILGEVLRSLENDAGMRADRLRLNRACCQPSRFVALEGAPLPIQVLAD
jgi:ArsR family transcriptional regulator